jgi:hypothetical protein
MCADKLMTGATISSSTFTKNIASGGLGQGQGGAMWIGDSVVNLNSVFAKDNIADIDSGAGIQCVRSSISLYHTSIYDNGVKDFVCATCSWSFRDEESVLLGNTSNYYSRDLCAACSEYDECTVCDGRGEMCVGCDGVAWSGKRTCEPDVTEPDASDADDGDEADDVVLIVVLVIVGVIVVAAVVVGVVVFMRRRQRNNEGNEGGHNLISLNDRTSSSSRLSTAQDAMLTDVKILEKLGGGNFGAVHKGNAQNFILSLHKKKLPLTNFTFDLFFRCKKF